MRTSQRWALSVVAYAVVGACGDAEPASANGVIQLVDVRVSPISVDCSLFLPRNATPDTILFQLHIVNTTERADSVLSAGSYGTVVRSTDPASVGTFGGIFASLPFTPQPVVVPAKTGDIQLRVAFPPAGLCQNKPSLYVGDEDVDISVRIRLQSGEYVTIPKLIKVVWREG